MSAIHPGNLHGTGTRTNKTRYHYARQRVQDAQKAKLDEPTDSKKEEPESKSSSNTTILIILIVLVCVTWGIAATAYFGIVDYKGLLARSSNVSAADAVDYASSLYPFQYEAVRHPLKFIGSSLTAIDDAITNFFTFNKAPFQIIDKRRQPTVAPARRLKKSVDLSKRDAPTEQLQKDSVTTPSDKKSQDQVDVDKSKTPKASEEAKQADSPKQSADKPDSPREKAGQEPKKPKDKPKTAEASKQPKAAESPKPSSDKPEPAKDQQEPEKLKDVSLTLNLHLFVGQDHTINESHLVSDVGSILRIGTKSLPKGNENSDPTPKCAKTDKKELFFALLPINKQNIPFCNGNPPVRRLTLEGLVQNPSDYTPQNMVPPPPTDFYHGNTKLVIDSVPNDIKLPPHFGVPPVVMTTPKFSNHHSNGDDPKFSKKLVIDTSPFLNVNNSGNFGVNNGNVGNPHPKLCGKNCFLALRFLNKNFFPRNGQNRIKTQKMFSRITLPNVVPKDPVRCPKNLNSQVFMFFGQKIALPNPTNKYFVLKNTENGDSKTNKNVRSGQKEVQPQSGRKSDQNHKNSPQNLQETAQHPKMNPGNKKSVKNFGKSKAIVPLSASSRCIVNVRHFVNRRMIFRGMENVVFNKILRNMRYNLGHGLRSRGMTNPCSRRMIQHYLKYDSAKLMHRKTNGLSIARNIRNVLHITKHDSTKIRHRKTSGVSMDRNIRNVFHFTRHNTLKIASRKVDNPPVGKNIRSVRFLQGVKTIVRGVTPPPARRVIHMLSPFMTSQKLRSHDLRRTRSVIPPPSRRVIRSVHHIVTSQKMNRVNVRNPSMKKVLQNSDVVIDRKKIFRGTVNPSASFANDGNNPKLGSHEQKILVRAMSNPTSNRVILKIKAGRMGQSLSNRNVMNPFLGKRTKDTEVRVLNRKVTVGGAVVFQVGRFVRAAMERERRILFSRLATAGTVGFDRQISLAKLRDLPGKRQKITPERKLTSREKLKQKFSRMFDRACDVINAIASVVRRINIFERTYKILPRKVKTSLEKAKNVTVISKILDITFNTTLNDILEFGKTSGNKIWGIIREKSTNFYNFLNKKPSMRNFFIKLSKFCQKMQRKYEKVSDMIGKNFIKLQYNQKLLTSILITLSVVGLYHIFYSCVDSIVPYRRR